MLLNARQQFVRVVLVIAFVAILAFSLQGAVFFNQTAAASTYPFTYTWVMPDTDDASGTAIACVLPPGSGSQGGAGGC